jgi:hypothetical protein
MAEDPDAGDAELTIRNKVNRETEMPSVKCSLKDCAYRGARGACHRKHIVLSNEPNELNELYCLGWATQETRFFTEAMNGEVDEHDERHRRD